MPFGLFILVLSVFFPLLMWIIKNEEKVVEFEDEILSKIKCRLFANLKPNESETKLYVVQPRQSEKKRDFSIEERNFVA